MSPSVAPRLMFYSHDLVGLGHLRRTLVIAQAASTRRPGLAQLLVTGTPTPHLVRLPPGAECLKLPHPCRLALPPAPPESGHLPLALRTLWRDALLATADAFRPHALLVDHQPAGVDGELVDTLYFLRRASPATRLIAGLRDVEQDAARTRATWQRLGVYELLDEVYDRILVYGRPELFDCVEEYGLSPIARAKARYVGYVARRPAPEAVERARRELAPRSGRFVLVTAGGGVAGAALFRAVLDCLRTEPGAADFDWLLVGGPLLGRELSTELEAAAAARPGVAFRPFVENLPDFLGAADVVISQGGSTIVETVLVGRPAVVVPYVNGSLEQLLRAEAFGRRGLVRVLHPVHLTPARLLDELRAALRHPPPPADLPLDGLANVADELEAILPPTPPPRT